MRNSFIFALIIFFMLLIIPTIALSYLENKIDSNNKEVATAPPPKIQILETPKAVKAEPYMIKVYDINTNETIAMDFEEYIKGVVASEMPAEFADEALKAQAVAARTYLLYRIKKYPDGQPEHSEASICTGIHCQVWSSKEKLISNHPEGWYNTYWSKIESAVESTASQVITYDAKIIEPLFHSASGGRTENSEDVFSASVPYLRSVDSPYEADAPKLHDSLKLSANDFINKIKSIYGELNLNPDNLKSVLKLTDVSAGGKVKNINISGTDVSGRDIRSLFNLNSTNFNFIQTGDQIEIVTTGYGHGVGMSQWGANGMAEEGYTYKDILKHYYTGVEIMRMK